ncbi:MAG: hypothetical protein GY938_12660 [Ketobacter sp.]|nr:hypothetical protein [Ketobacter sp.]
MEAGENAGFVGVFFDSEFFVVAGGAVLLVLVGAAILGFGGNTKIVLDDVGSATAQASGGVGVVGAIRDFCGYGHALVVVQVELRLANGAGGHVGENLASEESRREGVAQIFFGFEEIVGVALLAAERGQVVLGAVRDSGLGGAGFACVAEEAGVALVAVEGLGGDGRGAVVLGAIGDAVQQRADRDNVVSHEISYEDAGRGIAGCASQGLSVSVDVLVVCAGFARGFGHAIGKIGVSRVGVDEEVAAQALLTIVGIVVFVPFAFDHVSLLAFKIRVGVVLIEAGLALLVVIVAFIVTSAIVEVFGMAGSGFEEVAAVAYFAGESVVISGFAVGQFGLGAHGVALFAVIGHNVGVQTLGAVENIAYLRVFEELAVFKENNVVVALTPILVPAARHAVLFGGTFPDGNVTVFAAVAARSVGENHRDEVVFGVAGETGQAV